MRKVVSRIFQWGALAVLPAALLMMPMQEAKAQWVVSDPGTETNTMLTHVTQLLQYIKDVQMALSTLQQATMMAREVQQLATHPSTNIFADLAMFSNVLSQSQGLALNLAQMDVTFRNQFAPFSPSPLVNYAAQYNTWATTALGAVRGAANSGLPGQHAAERAAMDGADQHDESAAERPGPEHSTDEHDWFGDGRAVAKTADAVHSEHRV
jgi:P-type conjugative transfer protein TrbJ